MKKKIILIIGIVIFMLMVLAVGTFAYLEYKSSPKVIVSNYYKYQKKLDYENAEKLIYNYVGDDNSFNYEKPYAKEYMNKFSFKVINQKVDNNDATVEVKISKVDTGEILKKISNIIINTKNHTTNTNEEIINQTTNVWNEELNKKDIKIIENSYVITLVKKDARWQIINDDNLVKSLFDSKE